jgi:hypothetical protein
MALSQEQLHSACWRLRNTAVQTYREALAILPEDSPAEMRKDIQDGLNDALEDLHRRGWAGS